MNEWNIRKITKRIVNLDKTLIITKLFNREGKLLRDIMHNGKSKRVNYSWRKVLFWSYERQGEFDEECYTKIKIRTLTGRILVKLCFINSKLSIFTIYDKNGKEKIEWGNGWGDIDFIVSKNGIKIYKYSKMPLVDSENDIHYNSIRNIFYNHLGNKTVVFEKRKDKKTKTVYIYDSHNKIAKKICTELRSQKIISDTLYEYNKNSDLIYCCKKKGNILVNSTSYLYNERNLLVKSSEIRFDESQKIESQRDNFFSYDSHDRLIRKSVYYNNSKTEEENMEYDDSNNIIKKTAFDNYSGYREYFYKYEEKLCVEEEYICYKNDGTIDFKTKEAYKYDEADNKIQKTEFYNNGSREITSFDKYGNENSIVTYDDKSEIIKLKTIFRDINSIPYIDFIQDESNIVNKNSSGIPTEIYKVAIPGDIPYGKFRRTFIEYEYFK